MEDVWLAGIWLVLAAAAFLGQSELFNSLTLHGKLRMSAETRPSSLLQDVTVPKSWFWHFYLIAVAVAVALLHARPSVAAGLFFIHVSRRLLEQLFLFGRRSRSRMNVLAYFLGLGFYPLYGLSIWASATAVDRSGRVPTAALVFWAVFQVMQFVSHKELARLSAGRGYGIPMGWLFRLTWTPHYAAEAAIYAAMAVVTGGAAVKASAVFVAVSLFVNGGNQRRWYEAHRVKE
jgi:3-oxo-5-alpha-steroid 4-dehydrogenase 3